MFTAGQLAVQLGDEEHPITVLLAVRAGAHLAERSRLFTADVALVPWTFPPPWNQEEQHKFYESPLICWYFPTDNDMTRS